MKLISKTAIGASITALSLSVALTAGAAPAQAAVWDCSAYIDVAYNTASATCLAGFGNFRVRAECNSGHWPYTTTIWGPWIYRSSGPSRFVSEVSGDAYGCNVARAWYEV
ncbi:hypothetical protein ACQP2T_15205 [Nonomuraea sp. CA-143628]|uniref:hypothetical protein n=1 Tax=Nonomuraea sp. CA-143628 TaxID=3239997 RepID=UPI003D8A5758